MASRGAKLAMWAVVILVLVKAQCSVGCLEREKVGLLQLKSVFYDPNWFPFYPFESWQDKPWPSWVDEGDSNCCRWPGIKCHRNTGRVIALYLNFTPSIFRKTQEWYLNVSIFLPFEELTILSLSGNYIAGFIGGFEKFRGLKNLEALDLSYNQFDNSVLTPLSGLSSLKKLILLRNNLNGSFQSNELKHFINLKELDLSQNQMKVLQGFEKFRGLKNLEALDLSGNHFDNSVLTPLSGFSSLKKLILAGNNLNGSFQSNGFENFWRLKILEVLDLSDNQFENIVLTPLSVLTSLKKLILSRNNLNGPFQFNELKHFINLKELDLSQNQMKVLQGFEKFWGFKNLEALDLSDNEFNNSVLTHLSGLSSLKKLILAENNLKGSFQSNGFEKFWRLKNLEALDLRGNEFNNSVLTHLSGLSSLKKLILAENSLNGSFQSNELKHFINLKELDLSYNKIEVLRGLEESSALCNLETLLLSYNCLNNTVFASIRGLSSLKLLDLSENQLEGPIDVKGLCDLRNLQQLYLDGNQLEGVLPRCWGNFTSLSVLILSDNNLTGSVASHPFNILTSLKYLAIDRNHFAIPSSFRSFYNHSNLKALQCDYNILIPEVESHNCAPRFQLEYFSFSNGNNDKRVANLPSFLSHQHSLILFYFSKNHLSGMFPNYLLQNNTKLESLRLVGNSFGGPLELPSRPNPNTQILNVAENKLEGRIPRNISSIYPNLLVLNLSNNYFHGDIDSPFHDMDTFEVLDISNNHLSGVLPKDFTKNCPSLGVISLSDNNFSGKLSHVVSNLTNVYVLLLARNNFTGDIPESFSHMPLNTLDISDNHFSGELPRWIGNMTYIEAMVMSSNHFQGSISTEFCKLSSLRMLDISENNLYGYIPSCFNPPDIQRVHLYKNSLEGPLTRAFHNNTGLETLDLEENYISGFIPSWIGSLPSLSFLLLKANKLKGEIPTHLCQLSQLKIMDLSQNRLSGSLPPCLARIAFNGTGTLSDVIYYNGKEHKSFSFDWDIDGSIDSEADYTDNPFFSTAESTREKVEFTTKRRSYSYQGNVLSFMSGVDLSCNQLTGEIPPEIGNLSNIHTLNLSHNNFTGPIPATFSGLRQIESLDLSYNKLKGRIPPQLVQLNFLSSFSVAHNNLAGKTPDQKAQFANFDESSYEGNPLLCGPPILHNNCSKIGSASPMLNSSRPQTEEDDSSHMEAFYMSFLASYVVVLLGIATVLYINPYWRHAWFYFIEKCMVTSYYFIVDNFPKLPKLRTE